MNDDDEWANEPLLSEGLGNVPQRETLLVGTFDLPMSSTNYLQ